MGRAHLASIAQEGRDAVRAPQAHSQARQITTAGAERCARRVHPRSNRPEPPKARETDPNADPDSSLSERGKPRLLNKPAIDLKLFSVFFNGIESGHRLTPFSLPMRVRTMPASEGKASKVFEGSPTGGLSCFCLSSAKRD